MDIRNLKHSATESLLDANYPPRRLVLIHTGVALALSLVLMIVSEFLTNSMDSAGGLSGMGTQAMLSTAQVVLQLINLVVTPFWAAGLVYAALGYARRQAVTPGSLLEGFRRWKPILSSGLMISLQYLGTGFISMFLSSQLFMFSPFAAPMYEAALKVTEDPTLDIYALLGDSLMSLSIAYMVIFLIVYALFTLPVYYRYRMVNYLILDNPNMGGLQAMFISRALMRGKRVKLFKLDLSFWWFYLLEILANGLLFGDLILNALGVSLPVSASTAYWIFQILSMLCQLGLYLWAKPRLAVTYAHCYEAFLPQNNPEPEPKPQPPKNQPWTY